MTTSGQAPAATECWCSGARRRGRSCPGVRHLIPDVWVDVTWQHLIEVNITPLGYHCTRTLWISQCQNYGYCHNIPNGIQPHMLDTTQPKVAIQWQGLYITAPRHTNTASIVVCCCHVAVCDVLQETNRAHSSGMYIISAFQNYVL